MQVIDNILAWEVRIIGIVILPIVTGMVIYGLYKMATEE